MSKASVSPSITSLASFRKTSSRMQPPRPHEQPRNLVALETGETNAKNQALGFQAFGFRRGARGTSLMRPSGLARAQHGHDVGQRHGLEFSGQEVANLERA